MHSNRAKPEPCAWRRWGWRGRGDGRGKAVQPMCRRPGTKSAGLSAATPFEATGEGHCAPPRQRNSLTRIDRVR